MPFSSLAKRARISRDRSSRKSGRQRAGKIRFGALHDRVEAEAEEAVDRLGVGERQPDRAKRVARLPQRDHLAVDEHAVAIEYDDFRPLHDIHFDRMPRTSAPRCELPAATFSRRAFARKTNNCSQDGQMPVAWQFLRGAACSSGGHDRADAALGSLHQVEGATFPVVKRCDFAPLRA